MSTQFSFFSSPWWSYGCGCFFPKGLWFTAMRRSIYIYIYMYFSSLVVPWTSCQRFSLGCEVYSYPHSSWYVRVTTLHLNLCFACIYTYTHLDIIYINGHGGWVSLSMFWGWCISFQRRLFIPLPCLGMMSNLRGKWASAEWLLGLDVVDGV